MKDLLIVPSQHLLSGSELFNIREPNLLAVHAVVFDPIVKLFLDFLADLNFVIRCDGKISQVKQGVDVFAQQNTVRRGMRAAGGVWLDMS